MEQSYYDFFIDYYQDEDGVFTATVPALPGCVAGGKTLEEAYLNIKEAIESCLEVRNKLGMPISVNQYKGKNVYRVPINT
ncbi:MAG: hypothetical protein HW390_1308 [Candidatus Brocadiaceae bacterium]|nr:hypothetical protein [Candidatus Brocadiaceae bacterium]